MIGRQIGVYKIESLLGAGGMGEVYRARDIKLQRDVAIKALPAALIADADRSTRFEREARVLASLNHPHIGAIYGFEESQGATFLVLELVEGPTLAERIARGPVPISETVKIARQIADALDAAHEQGVVHRDLKPANIKLTTDRRVKVLDFGLAKLARDADPSATSAETMAATRAGAIFGTPSYMSPEQARGLPVDKRTDIWAFGCVLYAMLSGRDAFPGHTVSDRIAAVIEREPDWSALPNGTPPVVRNLLRRCLEKDLARRLRDIGDARFELEESNAEPNIGAPRAAISRRMAQFLPWSIATTAALIAGWALLGNRGATSSARATAHLDLVYPPGVEALNTLTRPFAISPEGRTLAFLGVKEGVRVIFVRHIDRPETVDVVATTRSHAIGMAFSPDGGHLAFIGASGLVSKVSLGDGVSRDLVSGADFSSSLTWGKRGLVFSRNGALWVVGSEGGEPQRVTTLDAVRKEVLHATPLFLPGESAVLFASVATDAGSERIEAVSMADGRRTVLVERASSPVWSPTGHLLFARDRAVFAVAFDPVSQTLSGTPVAVIPAGTLDFTAVGAAPFDVSLQGTLVAVPEGFGSRRIISVTRDGGASALDQPPGVFSAPRVSPDGRHLLVLEGQSVLTLIDLARGTRAPLMAGAFGTNFPAWNADGSRVVVSRRFSTPFWTASDGRNLSGPVPNATAIDYPAGATLDPDAMMMVRVHPDTRADVVLMSITGKFEPKPLVATPASEGTAQLSSDGRWLLYQSDVSGQYEMYVTPYPALDRHWQVSNGGAIQGRWSRTRSEIFYRNGSRMMSVTVNPSVAGPVFSKPVQLFADSYDFGLGATIPNYDVTPDGRFIMIRPEPNSSRLRVVLNWAEELKRILADAPAAR